MPRSRYSKSTSRNYKRAPTYQSRASHPYVSATAPAVGYAALQLAKYAVNHLNVEYKSIEAPTPGTVPYITTTALIRQFLPDVSQGDTANDRDGATIQWMSANQRFTLARNPSATDHVTIVRHIVFKVKNVNNTAPTASDVLAAPSDVNSPRNLDESKNIQVLKDNTYTLHANKPVVQGKVNLKWKKGMRTKYTKASTTGANASIENNYVYELWLSQVDPASTDNRPYMLDYRRARFIDN